MINITADEAFERVQLILHDVPRGAEKALYGIISRATTTIKKESISGITTIYDISPGAVKEHTAIKTKTKKVNDGVIGTIDYSGVRIPLFRFRVSHKSPRSNAPVTARQRRDRANARFQDAFIARMRSGHVGIFRRVPGTRMRPGHRINVSGRSKHAEEIVEIMAVSAAQMADDSGVLRKVDKAAQETIVKRTEHEISRILQGFGVR